MTVCLDTGVFLRIFGRKQPFHAILRALLFCDCAIAAAADFVVTEDHQFAALKTAGYKPQPLTPGEFIRLHLAAG